MDVTKNRQGTHHQGRRLCWKRVAGVLNTTDVEDRTGLADLRGAHHFAHLPLTLITISPCQAK
ncbi:MAG: hypothetical protein AAF601_17290 [Pseudomonadota bacterium]